MRKLLFAATTTVFLPFAFARPAAAQSVPISNVYSGGPGTYTLTGTVTSILNTSGTANTITLMDNSGSIIAFGITKANYTATVGDNVTFTGATDVTYQGAPELNNTGLTPTSITVNSTGNSTSPVVLTVPQFNAAGTGSVTMTAVPPYAEAIVSLNNISLPANTTTLATGTTYTLTDQSGNTTAMYTIASDSSVVAAVSSANAAETASGNTLYAGLVNIVGYADVFKGVPEIYPLSITAAPEPASLALIGFASLGLLSRRRRMAIAA